MTNSLQWPGKSTPNGFYPAACHMLDVASVAEILVAHAGFDKQLSQAIVFLAAMHDLGKFSSNFRMMIEGGQRGGASHWELSEYLLYAFDNELLSPRLRSSKRLRWLLYAATAGHHGKPPIATGDDFQRMDRQIGADATVAAGNFIRHCLEYWPAASLEKVGPRQFNTISWWLPGLVTVADWIGSNTDWFPQAMESRDLSEHLVAARQNASVAVVKSGLALGAPRDGKLYDFPLRPMQQAAADVQLPEGPVLAIIEDETGSGKTEAAMLLAQKMLWEKKGNGLFFALPTMATSNAMFKRAASTVGKMFDGPSLTLAHGRANLNVDYNDIKGRDAGDNENVTCAPWLTDSRRRALLAQVGVGTIDQALLSVLPTKHNALRIWGLSQKIVIVDEVHEMGNPYMQQELEGLLYSHAMQGGSAILLSATLPLKQRKQLVDRFEAGAGRASVALTSHAYPCLHIVGSNSTCEVTVPKSLRGPVHVVRLGAEAEAVEALVQAAKGGAACVWIRNSVDDALSAVQLLKTQGASPILIHARFAFADRQRIEEVVLRAFGRHRADRPGRILVGTQILESSLDLDFDVMVSDLAPMASLVQRAGRLWRHMVERPAAQRPVPAPVLHVLSPSPDDVESAKWLQNVMDKGSYVYPAAEQWRTAKHLFTIGKIDAPHGLRELIEAVHGPDMAEVPETLVKAELETMGKEGAEKNRGQQNVIDFAKDDYRSGGRGCDDVSYPTRLGPPQRTLMLVKRESGEMQLWAGQGAEGEMLSEVSAAHARLAKCGLPESGREATELQAFKKTWPEWKQEFVTVVEVAVSGRLGQGLIYRTDCGLIFD